MPPHNPPELRTEVLRWLAKGHSTAEAAEVFGVKQGTIDSWVTRYGLPDPAQSTANGPDEGEHEGEWASDLDRVEYLTRQVDELDGVIAQATSEKQWSSLRALYSLQDELHAKRVEVMRAEGSRLDLTEDPRAMALVIEAAGELLAMLTADLDEVAP